MVFIKILKRSFEDRGHHLSLFSSTSSVITFYSLITRHNSFVGEKTYSTIKFFPSFSLILLLGL